MSDKLKEGAEALLLIKKFGKENAIDISDQIALKILKLLDNGERDISDIGTVLSVSLEIVDALINTPETSESQELVKELENIRQESGNITEYSNITDAERKKYTLQRKTFITNVCQLLEINTQKELAQIMGIPHARISEFKQMKYSITGRTFNNFRNTLLQVKI